MTRHIDDFAAMEARHAAERRRWMDRHFPGSLGPTMEQIARGACEGTGFTVGDLRGPCKKADLFRVRAAAMHAIYEARRDDGTRRWSLPQVGRFFNRDHTTALNAITRHAQFQQEASHNA